MRDKVWFQLNKEIIQGLGKNIKSLWYGPFEFPKKVRDNPYIISIPPSHAHYLVLNVENIKLFECSMPKYVMENSPLWKGDTSIGSFP